MKKFTGKDFFVSIFPVILTLFIILFIVMPKVRDNRNKNISNKNLGNHFVSESVDNDSVADRQNKIIESSELVKQNCRASTDCPMAIDYAILSNCPYSSACVDGNCAVVCPVWEHSSNLEKTSSYNINCTNNSDCDCSGWDGNNRYDCICVDGRCASLVLSNDI